MAECHPVAFQWVTEAKLKGARIIHVDPRFTRTSAQADRHIPLRIGSDIVLLGALINHVLSNDLWFRDYVLTFTNAASVVSDDFRDTEELDGLFSGYDEAKHAYDTKSWAYATEGGDTVDSTQGHDGHAEAKAGQPETQGAGGAPLEHARIKTDPTLQDPNCVLNILKRHYARYTPEMVEQACGISRADFDYLADAIVQNSGRERTTAFCYAVGWTQHTNGAQVIRTSTILQLLMGNVGRPGSGIMALRGHASIQGSTDIPTLYNLLPGYLPMPMAGKHDSFQQYVDAIASKQQKGFWADAETYTVNLMKAWWGEHATKENDWAYHYLPKLTGAHGTYQTVMEMLAGKVDGYFLLGQNPGVASAHGRMQRLAMAELKWLVVRDLQMIESATFWQDSPEIETGELKTEDIATEVFFLPAASHAEKAGTFTQTHRLVQWREKGANPPGDAQSDLDFFHELGVRIRKRLAESTDPRDRPLLDLTWDYPTDEHGDVDAEAVLREINGCHLGGEHDGEMLNGFGEMKADGSTAGGCWIYSGVFAGGVNRAALKVPKDQQPAPYLEWAWAWPANRRVLYNRASADADGRPWSERKKLIWWDEDQQKWVGNDVPDFPATKAPGFRADPGTGGGAGLDGTDAFIMQSDGKAWLYAPKGLVDGPLPTHYEAQESPVVNPLYPVQSSPTRSIFQRTDNLFAVSGTGAGSEVYPHVFTTYRLTEHHTAGGMSRYLPYLAELQPELFCEISPELAEAEGLEHGGWATIISPRAAIEVRVMVTRRVTPLTINGRTVHQIGLPYHWAKGDRAVVEGDSVNDLLGIALDPNVQIQEGKVASCAIRPGRRPQGAANLELVADYQRRAGLTLETSSDPVTNLSLELPVGMRPDDECEFCAAEAQEHTDHPDHQQQGGQA